MKKLFSLILALSLLLTCVPAVPAYATEAEEVHEEVFLEPPEVEPATEETLVAEETVVVEDAAAEAELAQVYAQQVSAAPDPGLPDNDELFAGYVEQMFSGETIATFGVSAGTRLSGDAQIIYDALVPCIKQIAAGQREYAVISIGQTVNYEGVTLVPDVKAKFSNTGLSEETLNEIVDALLHDFPYEMYWYDKVTGATTMYLYGSVMLYAEVYLSVADNYSAGDIFTVDTAKTGAASKAVQNANAIVEEYASVSDHEKLLGYKKEICDLVSYNHSAANKNTFSEDNDPWQLIYVFDGDSNTNVVCEGYSKAFKYLCDRTAFAKDVDCYTVIGTLDGGTHMWNLVVLNDKTYLADVTNSDSDAVGWDGSLFLAGGTGSIEKGYRVGGSLYVYDQDTIDLWGTGNGSALNLAATAYRANGKPEILASGTCVDGLTWTLDEEGLLTISGKGDMIDYEFGYRNPPWLSQAVNVTKLVVESGVTRIGKQAFQDMNALTTVELPETVTSIGHNAFQRCHALKNIKLPSGLKELGGNAFASCSSLQSIEIPKTLARIEMYAFGGCSYLTNVTLHEGLVEIGDNAFAYTNLTSLTLPSTVTAIYDYAFKGCDFTEVVLPAKLNYLGKGAFSSDVLEEIKIPGSLPATHAGAFDGYRAIIRYPADDPTWTAEAITECGGNATWVDMNHVHNFVNVEIKATCANTDFTGLQCTKCGGKIRGTYSGVILDHDMADATCTEPRHCRRDVCDYTEGEPLGHSWKDPMAATLVCATCGHSLEHQHAFEEKVTAPTCTEQGYTDVICTICKYSYVDKYVDALGHTPGTPNCTTGAICKVCNEVCEKPIAHAYKKEWNNTSPLGHWHDCANCDAETDFELHVPNVEYATNKTAKYCTVCGYVIDERIDVQTVKVIAEGLHDGGPIKWKVTSDGVLTISGNRSMQGQSTYSWEAYKDVITLIVVEDGITTIPNKCFQNLSNVTSVYIGNAVTKIGESAFNGCKSLYEVTIPANVEEIAKTAFSRCGSLVRIRFAEGSKMKTFKGFSFCTSLQEIYLTDGLQTIDFRAFDNCESLRILRIPATVETINSDLSPLDALETLENHSTVSLGDLSQLESLKTVIWTGNNTNIPDKCFKDCKALTTVVFGENIAKLGEAAFQGCTALQNITLGDRFTYVSTSAFKGCTSLSNVVLGKNIENIDLFAFEGCTSLETITLPEGLIAINPRAFERSGLKKVTFPESLKTIFNSAFADSKLEKIVFKGKAPYINNAAFKNVTATISYHGNKSGWTEAYKQDKDLNYMANLTWVDMDAHDHSYTSEKLAPTCTESGMNIYTCSCGHEYKEGPFAPLGHKYVVNKVDNAPGKPGYTEHTCSRCGDYYRDEETLAADLATPVVNAQNDVKTGKPLLTWTAIPAADGYEIYRSTSSSKGYTSIGYTDQASFLDDSASAGYTYYYQVKAVYAADESFNSELSKYVTAKCLYPQVEIAVTNNSNGVPVISWTKVSGAKNYEIYYASAKDGNYTRLTGTTSSSYTHSNASSGKAYYYKVRTYGSSSSYAGAFSEVGYGVRKLAQPSITVTANHDAASVKITWSKISGATGYELQCSVNGGEFETIQTLSGLSYTHEDLTIGNTYTYRLCARSAAEEATGNYSSEKAATIKCGKPILTVGNDENGKPTLSWNNVKGVATYEIQMATSSRGKYTQLAVVTDATYTHVDAVADKTYYYKVRAIAATGAEGDYCSSKSVTCDCLAPVMLEVTNNSNGYPVVNWEKTDGAKKYEVWYATSADGTYKKLTTTSSTSCTHTSSSSGSGYFYKVRAYGSSTSSTGAYSGVAYGVRKLAQPSISISTNHDTSSVKITWSKISGATGYELQCSVNGGEFATIQTQTSLNYTHEDLDVGSTYTYRLCARSAAEEATSNYSSEKAATIKCGRPAVTVGNDENGKPTLTWNNVKGAATYEIQMATSSRGKFTQLAVVSETGFVHTDAVADKTYYYKVRAIDVTDTAGDLCDYKSVTCDCMAPVIKEVTNNSNGYPVVSWEKTAGAKKYEVWYATAENGTYKRLTTTSSTSCTHTSSSSGSGYFYKVRAYGSSTSSTGAYSGIVYGVRKLAQPSITVTANHDASSVKITWSKISGATGYELQCSVNGGEFATIQTQTSLNFTHEDLNVGSTYTYRLCAHSAAEEATSNYSTEKAATIKCGRPVVTVGNDENGKPTLTWNAVKGAATYEIQMATSSRGKYTQLATTTETGFIHADAVADKTYYYKVRAIDATGTAGDLCDYKSVTCDCLAPVIKEVTNNSKGYPVVSWEKTTGAKKYELWYATSADGTYKRLTTTSSTSCTHTSSSSGCGYFYKVRAYGSSTASTGAYSEVVYGVRKLAQPSITVTANHDASSVKITWSKISGATGYELQCSVNGGDFATIQTQNSLNYTHEDLTVGNTYTYRLCAHSAAEEATSNYSTEKTATIKCGRPVVTTGNDEYGKPTLTWNAVKGAATYEIQMATSSRGKYTQLAVVSDATYIHADAVADKTYYYKVRAIDATGTAGDYCNYTAVTCDCLAPVIKEVTNNTNGYPVVSWEKTAGAKKYEIWYANAIDGTYKRLTTTSSASYTYSNASMNTEYYFKVRAYGSSTASTGAYSDVVYGVRKLAQPSITVTANHDASNVKISWKKINGAVNYELQCSVDGGEFVTIQILNALAYTHEDLNIGSTYTYRLRACSNIEAATGNYSAEKAATIKCGRPVVTTGNDEYGKPTLTWNNVKGAATYEIQMATSSRGKYTQLATTTETGFIHADAVADKTYYYKVRAIDATGTAGDYCNYTAVTCDCLAPVIKEVTNNSNGYPVVSWEKTAGAKKYEVWCATDANGTYKRLTTTSSVSYTYTNASMNTEYYFKVRAYGSSTSSTGVYSDVVHGIRKVGQPGITLSTNQSGRKITISWKKISNAVSYELQCSINGGAYETIAEGTALSFVHEGLIPGNQYSYRLRTIGTSQEANSDYCSVKSSTIKVAKPNPTMTLSVEGKPEMIWDSVEGAVSYQVYYASSKNGSYKLVGTTEATSFVYVDAVAGKTCYFKVRAVDVNGTTGDYSMVMSIKSK